jgi:HSP20 family molecular chaperone IbpA
MLPDDISVDVSPEGLLTIQGEHSDQRKRRDESGRVFRTERVRRR